MSQNKPFTFGSLFSGIGGLDLGLEWAGMECRWFIENDDYCNQILAKRWPHIRRYNDVKEIKGEELETVDLIAGGFPCQPHSVAGKRRGAKDDRNLWPEFIRIIREARPRYVIGENVPGIITTYLDTVLSDLENAGYTAWAIGLPAVAFDAPHRRQRIFILGHTEEFRRHEGQLARSRQDHGSPKSSGRSSIPLENASRVGRGRRDNGNETRNERALQTSGSCSSEEQSYVANTRKSQQHGLSNFGRKEIPETRNSGIDGANPTGEGLEVGRSERGDLQEELTPIERSDQNATDPTGEGLEGGWKTTWEESKRPPQDRWWQTEPNVGRVVDGTPNRVDRLRCLGNAVVPQIGEFIGKIILQHARKQP